MQDAIGLDFGTTNSVVARVRADGQPHLVDFAAPEETSAVFRSALCFWEEDGLAYEAGPWAIADYLEYPQGSRFLQSFKSVAASATFEHASVFDKRFRFEELGKLFLAKLSAHAGGALATPPSRVVVGRPVHYAGARPDEALARQRYDAMFAGFGAEIHYVYEPLGAAFSYAARLEDSATILVADFGGGTSDFSVVRVAPPGSPKRCTPLGHAGIGIAGDQFDSRIVDKLVLPILGFGGLYRSFDKQLEIPRGYFADFSDWSRLALMRNRRTLEELRKLQRSALDPEAIGRMIAIIEQEQGYRLYDSVGQLKRALSRDDAADFHFDGEDVRIDATVTRAEFEGWIAADLARMKATVDRALAQAGVDESGIDRVFLTGGTSLIPSVRALFTQRFGEDRIASGGELTSIANGLALIGQEEDVAAWAV
ncbi:molecular chaperone Hsp70 [Sphingomonas panacis]|uniref:Molecular chaperone Hsp70 n=1 Tax=Sphingomonas panacis TaxID=1560345 RepID=A0A1B3Z9F3_9SPHN|nr:Hsp70 family protein [Sphingomonas panacis]AOH84042.1 molecular chaperone Hsp70 [Sphingomonas panacis]